MIETLDKLSLDENEILNQVKILKGSIEEIEHQLVVMGVSKRYEYIYEEYIAYYESTKNMEAFKRIIFIQWYGASEPLAFTGIGDLKDQHQSKNLELLKQMIYDQSLDSEFKWMIRHYYSISDWYFNSCIGLSELIKSFSSCSPFYFNFPFKSRGQMGAYWQSQMDKSEPAT